MAARKRRTTRSGAESGRKKAAGRTKKKKAAGSKASKSGTKPDKRKRAVKPAPKPRAPVKQTGKKRVDRKADGGRGKKLPKKAAKRQAPKRKITTGRGKSKKKDAKKSAKPSEKPSKKPSKKPVKTRRRSSGVTPKVPVTKPRVPKPTTQGPAKKPRVLVEVGGHIRVPKAPVFMVRGGDVRGFDEGKGFMEDRVMLSSHTNSLTSDHFEPAFRGHFIGYLRRTPYEDPDDLCIYRWGVAMRTVGQRSHENIARMERELIPKLQAMLPPGAAIHISREKGRSLMVRVGFGDYVEDTYFTEVTEEIARKKELMQDVLGLVRDVFEDGIWATFFDVDEADATGSP